MPPVDEPLTKKDLEEALKAQTDDIVGTLTTRSEALENKLDALETSVIASLKRIEGKLDAALLLDLKVGDLEKRVARLERHAHLVK